MNDSFLYNILMVGIEVEVLSSERQHNISSEKFLLNDREQTWKLVTVYLPYVKSLAKKIQKICSPYDIKTIFRNGPTLWKYLFQIKPPTEYSMS